LFAANGELEVALKEEKTKCSKLEEAQEKLKSTLDELRTSSTISNE
jgi:hypothetical protein